MRLLRPVRLWRSLLPLLVILTTVAGLEALVLLAARHSVTTTREDLLRATDRQAHASALALRETVSRTLEQIDALQALASLVTRARLSGNHDMEAQALQEIIAAHVDVGNYVRQVSALTAEGLFDWSTGKSPAEPHLYFGDREHIQAILTGAAKSVISPPVTGRISGLRTIQCAKGVYDDDGRLLGVTVVSVDPIAFSRLGEPIGVTGTDTIALRRLDGMILARNHGHEGEVSGNALVFQQALQSRQGASRVISAIDGVPRSVARERLDEPDLMITVGLDLDLRLQQLEPELQDIRQESRIIAALIGVLGAGAALAWFWRRRTAADYARQALIQESERLFRQLAESIPDMIMLLDRDDRILYANTASGDVVGVEPEALIGLHAMEWVHPEDQDSRVHADTRPSGDRQRGVTEVRVLRPDGGTVWVQTTTNRLPGDDHPAGAPARICASRDVTAQREAESALMETKTRLNAVLEAASGVLFRSTLDQANHFRLTFVSGSIEKLTGFTPDEALEPGWMNGRRDPGAEAVVKDHFNRLIASGTSRTEYKFLHRNGTWRWHEQFAHAPGGSGNASFVGYFRDITEDRELDRKAAESAKMAILGEMTTGMAHELNQPLAAISMLAQNAGAVLDIEKPRHRSIAQKLERMIQQVDRAASIIDVMRNPVRDAPAPGQVVADAITGALAVLEERILNSGICLIVQAEPDLPNLAVARLSLEQVLINLIANAVDAIEAQGDTMYQQQPRIEITAFHDANTVVITVADHAGGIGGAGLQNLFEPYFTTKPAGSGTGLGLSLSTRLVHEMGGVLQAANKGDGAVLEIRLPASMTARAHDPAAPG